MDAIKYEYLQCKIALNIYQTLDVSDVFVHKLIVRRKVALYVGMWKLIVCIIVVVILSY